MSSPERRCCRQAALAAHGVSCDHAWSSCLGDEDLSERRPGRPAKAVIAESVTSGCVIRSGPVAPLEVDGGESATRPEAAAQTRARGRTQRARSRRAVPLPPAERGTGQRPPRRTRSAPPRYRLTGSIESSFGKRDKREATAPPAGSA